MHKLICRLLLLVTSAKAIVPRENLLDESTIESSLGGLHMSVDGKMVGFLAPDANNVKNVFTLRLADHQKRQVTFEPNDVYNFAWTAVKDIIIFMRDNNGDENFMLFKKNISQSAPKADSTAISQKPGVAASVQANNLNDRFVLVAMNDMIPEFHNIYKFDLYTNELTLVFENKRFMASFIYADNNMNIKLASEQQDNGDYVYYRVSPNANSSIITSDAGQWKEYFRVKSDDAPATGFVHFDSSNQNVYWKWGADTDLGSLIVAPFNDFSKRKVLYNVTQGELQNVLFHPKDNTLLAFSENYHKPEIVIHNETVAEDIKFLTERRPTDSLNIISSSNDINTWLCTYDSSEKPNEIFVYRRKDKSIDVLFNLSPMLKDYTLNKQIGFDFDARDGLRIQAYLSLPLNVTLRDPAKVLKKNRKYSQLGMLPAQPQKMVVLVHGGPKGRDLYGFDPQVAHLTSRGYAVMQVNFRGSTGFGKRLTNAGNGEWSRKMHTDLLDAVDFVVARRIANRSAIAIMGISYGGYATLSALTFTPDVFACGVDIVGPSNLLTLMETLPPYWKSIYQMFIEMCGGDPATDEGRKELIARSPFFIADRVKKPLMIMQGANDPRVKQQESEQFVSALKNHSIPVTYVLYPDEGHGFRRTPNVLAQFGFAERFLHNCLGGEYEPFTNGQYNESAIVKADGYASVEQLR